MKPRLVLICAMTISSIVLWAQSPTDSPFNANHWGVVLEHPDMKMVKVKKGVSYYKDDKIDLQINMFFPPKMRSKEKLPVIVFMNGFGDPAAKSMGIYQTWPALVAAHGFIGVAMDSDPNRLHESFTMLFKFLGAQDNIDGNRIGVYAASANIRESAKYLLSASCHPGVKAAVLYYGEVPALPYRKDLPVLFMVSELDARHTNYSTLWSNVLESKAPWTVMMASGMPHGFDAFSDTSTAKTLILQTIDFWKTYLRPEPISTRTPSLAREIIATQYSGDFQKIVRLMNDWMKENPGNKDPAAYRLLGNALMRTGGYAEAETIYKKAIELAPDDRGSRLNMVVISHALDKAEEAKRYLAEYEEGKSPEGFTYGYVARLLIPLNKPDVVIPYFERAIELGPHPSDYYNLACFYALKGEKDKAFANLFLAAEKGFNYKNDYENDEDLKTLRSDNRWSDLQQKLR